LPSQICIVLIKLRRASAILKKGRVLYYSSQVLQLIYINQI